MFLGSRICARLFRRQTDRLSPDGQNQLESALARGRRDGALTLNKVRLALTTGIGLIYLAGALFFELPNLRQTWWMVLIYAAIGAALFVAANRTERVALLSRFAIPVIDMPFILIIQWFNIAASENPEASAMFSLSVFLFLTMLSALSMRPHQVFASGAMALICQTILTWAGELPALTYVANPVMLALTAWMASDIPRRRMMLIRDAAEREARRNRLSRYFSPGVAEVIEQQDDLGDGEACEISVLFADIRGFTQLSEKLDAAKVVAILNEFHGHMVDEVFEQAGTLDKYLGDGLMAYFNAPVRQPDHAIRAVKCALAMETALKRSNERKGNKGDQQLLAGIGIHCGAAIVGAIGAPHRREFTAIGDTVNVASRLQGLTKDFDGVILVSES